MLGSNILLSDGTQSLTEGREGSKRAGWLPVLTYVGSAMDEQGQESDSEFNYYKLFLGANPDCNHAEIYP